MRELGQLFITGISGKTLTEDEITFLKDENIGGVILFSHNFENIAQLAELINNIQTLRNHYPLFIAVDHEGGRVIRFKDSFTQFPAMEKVSKLDSPKLCFSVYDIMAKELKSCGINVNLSPVCDVTSNTNNKVIGDRSFGSDAEKVSLFISSAIRGLQTNEVMACAKHFPGHGNTSKDSHFDLPIIKKSIDALKAEEFIPFVKAVKSRVEMVMMAHLLVDSIDEEFPCTLSEKAYSLLRSELKFKKIIITDDMEMKAITDRYEIGEAAFLALNAGADIVEYKSFEKCREAYEYVKDAYKKKKLSKEKVEEKIERINSVKKEYLSNYKPVYVPDVAKNLKTKEAEEILSQLVE